MLRSKQFLAMKKEAERGLQRNLVSSQLQNKTLGSFLYQSSGPLYDAIGVSFFKN